MIVELDYKINAFFSYYGFILGIQLEYIPETWSVAEIRRTLTSLAYTLDRACTPDNRATADCLTLKCKLVFLRWCGRKLSDRCVAVERQGRDSSGGSGCGVGGSRWRWPTLICCCGVDAALLQVTALATTYSLVTWLDSCSSTLMLCPAQAQLTETTSW